MLGWDYSEMLRQLALLDKEMLRETLHEAGHCVAAWHLGFPVRKMNVRESIAIERGYKSVSFEIPQAKLQNTPDETNFSLAIVCLAGMAAEGVMFRKTFKRSAWKSDIDDAKAYLKDVSFDEKQSILFQRAVEITKEIVQENWNQIARLTVGTYYLGPVLNGEQILELITGEAELVGPIK